MALVYDDIIFILGWTTPLQIQHVEPYIFIKVIIIWCFFVGARVNAKDNMWLTPLHRAVASRSEVGLFVKHALTFK